MKKLLYLFVLMALTTSNYGQVLKDSSIVPAGNFTVARPPTEVRYNYGSSTFPKGSVMHVTNENAIYTADTKARYPHWTKSFDFSGPAGGRGVDTMYTVNDSILMVKYTDGTVHTVGKTKGAKGDKGDKGDSIKGDPGPAPFIVQGTTTTGAAGSAASATLRLVSPNTYAYDFVLPKGADGAPGSGGVMSGGWGGYNPTCVEYWRPKHANRTYAQEYGSGAQTYLDTAFGGKIKLSKITINDQIDLGAWQTCLDNAPSGTMVTGVGTYYFNRSCYVPVMKYLELCSGIFWSVNQNIYDFFYRDKPADNNTAMVWAIYKVYYRNLVFMGNGVGLNQTGINVNSNFGARYDNIVCENMAEGIRMTFQINVLVQNCYVTGCLRGWTVDWIPGFNPATYQSNHVMFIGCRAYGNARNTSTGISGSEYAFKFDQVSGGVLDHCIIEGKSFINGVLFLGANSTVVPNLRIINETHVECEQGCDVAAVNIDQLRQGLVLIDGMFGQYATLMIKAKAGSGTPTIIIQNVIYWVGRTDGKTFESIGCNWTFMNNTGPLYDKPSLAIQFVGSNVTECGGDRCGINKFKFYGLPSSQGGASAARVRNSEATAVGRLFNPWLDELPSSIVFKQVEMGPADSVDMINNKPSQKIRLVYEQNGMELKSSPVYRNYTEGYTAFIREMTERTGYNEDKWPDLTAN